jgi:hypothetical protein
MELTYATIVVLASLVFVLSGMVGYLYWQQTRILQNVQSLAIVVSSHFSAPPLMHEEEQVEEKTVEEKPVEEDAEETDAEEDDRVSVKEEVEKVEGPPKVDVDDLQDKTKKQLQELLTKKGIPYNKADAKPVLIQLLKATA